jgi:hypothetical protein
MYEAAFYQPPSSMISPPTFDFQRIEYLTACMYATKSALDTIAATPMLYMSMLSILGLSHAAQVLYRLSILDYPGWDRALCRATVDVLWYFEEYACNMERADAHLKQEMGEKSSTLYSEAGPAWRGTALIWREGLEKATVVARQEQTELGTDVVPDFDHFGIMDPAWLSMSDDIWFSNLFPR